MNALKSILGGNRPIAAGGLAGAVALLGAALIEWGLASFTVPTNVQDALVLVVVMAFGGLFGKIAQRKTWPEVKHKASIAYALQLDPEHWEAALSALGMTRTEALEAIGVDPNEVP